jgi:hypothetical protein
LADHADTLAAWAAESGRRGEGWDALAALVADVRRHLPALSDPTLDAEGQRHATGSDTERAAALAVMPRSGTQRATVLEAIAASPSGLTDAELAEVTGLYLYSAAPRRCELVAGGWVRDTGRRRRTGHGNPAAVWVLTLEGAERLAGSVVS